MNEKTFNIFQCAQQHLMLTFSGALKSEVSGNRKMPLFNFRSKASSIDLQKPSERLARREAKLAERWKEAYRYQNGGKKFGVLWLPYAT